MKIVFLSHTDSNLFRFRLPIMLALKEQGHDVIALIPKGEDFDKFPKLGIEALEYHIKRSSLNPFSALSSIQEIAHILKTIHPDIVHTFMLKPNIYGAFAAKIAGIPYVINSLTGLGSFYIQNNTKAKIFRFIIESLNRVSFKIAKKVLFQNQDDLDLFVQKRLLDANKTALIKGSGIDTQTFLPYTQKEKEALHTKLLDSIDSTISKDSTIILMIARAILHKGVKEYYQAAQLLKAKYPNFVFLYVGGVDLGNIAPIDETFLKSSNAVIYLGERKDIRELIGICDVFVLPSFREGIPRTLLEAGSMAKPIITTNAVGCREVVENGVNGFLVEVGNVESLKENLEKLCIDKPLQERFGRASREKICKEFSIESIIKQYLELYQEVLNAPKTSDSILYQSFIKPIFDFSFSALLILLFAPILIIVALLIHLKLGSPIFFTQERPGKNGKIFKIYKFRTMSNARDANGELLPDSERLKGFGKFVRKSSLDELPQLFNVLKGEMSFIGPRPLLVEYLPLYSKTQARRHEVKPGITGWAQVNGRNAISWEEKFKLDVWYVENLSFWLDCKIFLMTFYKVLKRKDISSQTNVTMEKFTGSKESQN